MSTVYPYREIKSFKAFVQTVLPTVYDDSLSYYELLNKVVEHLNTMGVTINTMQAWINANAIETYDIIVNSTYGNISNIIDDVKTAVNDNQIVRFIVNPPGLYKYVCYYSGGAVETIPETDRTRDIMYFCGFKVESSTRNTFRIFKLDTTNGNYTEYDYKLINESDLTSVVNNIFTYIDNTVNSAIPVHGEYNATSGVLSDADYEDFDSAINAGKVCSITVKRSNNPDVTCYYTSKVIEQNEQFETFIFSGDTLNTNGSVKGVISVKVKPENVSFIETNIETDLTAINLTFDVIKQDNTYTLNTVNRTPTEVISALSSNSNLDAKIRVYSAASDYLFAEYHDINYYGLTTSTNTTIALNCSFTDEFQNNIMHYFNFYQDDNNANAWKMRHSTNTEYYSLNFAIMPTSVQDDTPTVQTASATPSEISGYLSRVIHKPIRCYFSVVGGDTNTVYYQANGYSCNAYKYKENSSSNEKVVVSFTDYPMYIEGDTVNNTWSVYKKNTEDEIDDLKSALFESKNAFIGCNLLNTTSLTVDVKTGRSGSTSSSIGGHPALQLDENASYDSYCFFAPKDMSIVATAENNTYYAITKLANPNYSDWQTSGSLLWNNGTSVSRVRKSENNLPTTANPMTLQAGTLIAVTVAVGETASILIQNGKTKTIKSELLGVASPYIDVEMHNGYFYYYIPTVSGNYLRYKFVHFVDASSNADGWGQRVVDLVTPNKVGIIMSVVRDGEWEMAIMLKDRPDFIGTINHGSEISTIANLYFDGVKTTITDGTKLTCKEIRVNQKSTMYDPNDETTIVGYHYKTHFITADGIKIEQRIDWVTNQTLGISYCGMLPATRGNDYTSSVQVTDHAYDNKSYEEYDCATTTLPTYLTSFTDKGNAFYLRGETSGISMSIECNMENRPTEAFTYLSNAIYYNKVYCAHNNVDYQVANGDVWKWVSIYKIEYAEN